MNVYNRYAQALFDLAKDKDQIADIYNFKSNLDKDVQDFFSNPVISFEDKNKIIDMMVKTKLVKFFLKLMLDRGRTDFLSCIKSFEKISDMKNNLARGKVVSAIPLSKEEKKILDTVFLEKINKKVIFEYEIDKSILGGIKVIIGGLVFEDTLSNRLNKLKEI